jgi:galactokinase
MPDVREQSTFARVFGRDADVAAHAPARVNLIGEHTDYHQGFVLPMPLPQRTMVSVRRRADYRVCAFSDAVVPAMDDYLLGEEETRFGWIDYVQGVTSVLAKSGHLLTGFDVAIESTVPPGGGVSSSAALSVALLRALAGLNRCNLSDVEIARLAHRVEADFVGAPTGMMDQMACSVGRDHEALFLDTRSLAFERLPWPESLELIVIHSGVSHAHAGGEYVVRRRESFAAAGLLGVRWLRDARGAVPPRAAMPEVLRRRARHVITENQRVLDAVEALRRVDGVRLGALFNESHASMRDDYEISLKEIDTLVELGQADPDVLGARLTGGGFGGCVVMLAAAGRGRAAAERIAANYRHAAGRDGSILLPVGQTLTTNAERAAS